MADCVWIQGSALMEAHPVGSRWAMKARERGAKIIHVDPHFSRTSAVADLYVPIRAGTDIAFLGGLVPRLRRALHERLDDPARGLQGHRGSGRAVQRLRPGDRRV